MARLIHVSTPRAPCEASIDRDFGAGFEPPYTNEWVSMGRNSAYLIDDRVQNTMVTRQASTMTSSLLHHPTDSQNNISCQYSTKKHASFPHPKLSVCENCL